MIDRGWLLEQFLQPDAQQDQQQEVKELISDAKMHDIIVMPPKVDNLQGNFNIKNGNIYFGLQDVKYIGESQVEKVISGIKAIEEKYGQEIKDISWYRILINLADKINSNAMLALISIGALNSDYTISRNKMLYEFETWSSLTKKEKEWVLTNCDQPTDLFPERGNKGLETALERLYPTKKEGGGTHNAKRKDIVKDLLELLKNPPYELEDTPDWIATEEHKYLGASLTYSKIDGCDTGAVNTTCKEFLDGKPGKVVLGVEVVSTREWTIKKGNSKGEVMAFLSVEDSTATMDSVILFPDSWSKNKPLLYAGNTVLLSGKKSSKTGERYLPEKAIKALSDPEYKLTSKLKRKTMKKGKQFSKQPKFISKKVKIYRDEWKIDIKSTDGRYTKPILRKKLFQIIKATNTHGTKAGQWSARKAQYLAKKYKVMGGGYY